MSTARCLVCLALLCTLALPLTPHASADDRPEPTPSVEPDPPSPTPAPTEAPPAPTEAPPAPTEVPPAPTEVPPAPTEAPPAPTEVPPAPTEVPPVPTEAPPAPTEVPPAPTEPPPAPTEPPPAPAEVPPAAPAVEPVAPTYRVFATREGLVGRRTANGHRIQPRDRFVALPSWSVLSSRGGNEFQVRVTYRGRSVTLPVWDVGPWNTHDDYWSPNRRYSDLPVGLPMAQAARLSGYNGGRDEFGRRIRLYNGIDIADGAFWDDLGMSHSDWVEVTFLWLGRDPGAPAAPVEQAVEAPIVIEPEAIVVDDADPGYGSESEVNWYDAACGLNGRHTWTYATAEEAEGENRARWTPALPGSGFYEVFAYIPPCGHAASRAARYRVIHSGSETQVVIDQSAAAGGWASLGTFHMGEGAAVELDDVSVDDDTIVRFDAVKFVPRVDAAPPDARALEAIWQPDGSLLVRWGGSDNLSGIASYDVQVRRLPDGGWTDWQQGVAAHEAVFVPPEPGAYGFRARARDWAGLEQAWREEDEVVASR